MLVAEIADVYRAIDAVDRWPLWVGGVVAPVRALGGQTFEVSRIRDGTTTSHRVVITARGPAHTLNMEVDQRYRVYFRTRPHPSGTHVEVVAEPLGKPNWRHRLLRRRRTQERSALLNSLLDRLAARVEHGDNSDNSDNGS